MSLYLFFIPIPIPAWLFGILYLLYSIYGMKKSVGNIGHDAHFGGALAGLFFNYFDGSIIDRNSTMDRRSVIESLYCYYLF